MKDAMVGRKDSIISYAVFLGLYIFLPFAAAASDSDAAQGSLYNGYVTAAWYNENCATDINSVGGYTLTFGPFRGNETNRDPYYLLVIDSGGVNFSASMESSTFTDNLQRKWWDVNAYLERTGYRVNGSLEDTEDIEKGHNFFLGTAESDESATCGSGGSGGRDFRWSHQKNQAVFNGTINSTVADIMLSGVFSESTDSSTRIRYGFHFVGSWVEGSAELSMEGQQPTWKSGKSTKSGELTTASTGTAPTRNILTTPPASENPTPDPSVALQGPGVPSSDGSQGDSRSIGPGAITGIIVGSVSFIVFAGAIGFWWFTSRRNSNEEVRVYPELAYLYTPSPVPTSESHGHGQEHLPPPSAQYRNADRQDLESREVLVRDDTMPVEVQHQWRVF